MKQTRPPGLMLDLVQTIDFIDLNVSRIALWVYV